MPFCGLWGCFVIDKTRKVKFLYNIIRFPLWRKTTIQLEYIETHTKKRCVTDLWHTLFFSGCSLLRHRCSVERTEGLMFFCLVISIYIYCYCVILLYAYISIFYFCSLLRPLFFMIVVAVSLSFGFLRCKGMAVLSDTKHQAMPYSAKTFLECLPQMLHIWVFQKTFYRIVWCSDS